MANQTMSKHGLKLLAEWEGIMLEPYKDAAGLETIGIGHLITKEEKTQGFIRINEAEVNYKRGLTKAQAYELLEQDLKRFENVVNEEVQVPLRQNQFDALVSFSFNVGTRAFSSSTLIKLLNEGKYEEVPTQLRRWNKSGGKVIQGLVNRRKKEIVLWSSA